MQYAIMLDRNDYGIIFGSFLLIRKDFLTHLCIFFSFFFFFDRVLVSLLYFFLVL